MSRLIEPDARDDSLVLADAIVRAWEAEGFTFAAERQCQMALIAARFLVRVANSKDRTLSGGKK